MDENDIQKRARLEREVKESKEKLRSANDALGALGRQCRHDWGETETAFIHHKGYQFQGDPPGTMGVDRQLPFYVQPKTDKRWKRVCKKCGETDYTTSIKKNVVETPNW
jgi:hypothetical protein